MDRLLPLAVEQHRQGNLEQADAICGHILQQMPAFANALYMRAVIAHQRGQHALALEHVAKAIVLVPENHSYHNLAGISHFHLGQTSEAIISYREAIRMAPDVPDPHSNLALALIDAGQLAEAEAQCREALRLRPNYAEAYLNLGKILGFQSRLSEAIECFQAALGLNPNLLDARRNLGHALQEQGDFAASREQYREVLRQNPRDAHAYYGLAKIKRYTPADEWKWAEIESLLTEPHLLANERSYLHFALGKIFDDCGRYDEAFGHYEQANQLMGRVFDREEYAQSMLRRKAIFTRELFENFPHRGSNSEQPVFIVGMPRSATTLVEQIVASHPQAFGAGELTDIDQIVAEITAVEGGSAGYPECVRSLTAERLHELAEGYLARRRQVAGQALRVTDKMPWNFGNLGLIALLFPNARVIHCRRNPLDVCLSCYFTRFTARMPFAWDLGDLGFFYRHYESLMEHRRRNLPLRMLQVDYEDLIRDQEGQTRRIIEFCGLEWDDRCLEYHQTRRVVQTASNWQVRQPLYSRAIGRWQNYARHLEPLVRALQETDTGPPYVEHSANWLGLPPAHEWTTQVVAHHFGNDGM